VFDRTKKAEFGPSIEDLRLDLDGKGLASAWNKRASCLFAEHFLQTRQYECQNAKRIQTVFKRHLITLQAHYRDALRAANSTDEEYEQERHEKKKQRARDKRRRSVRFLQIIF